MSGSEIVDAVLKVAEKVSTIDIEQTGKNAVKTVKKLNAGNIVNAINVNNAERVERRTMAALDVHNNGSYNETQKSFQ